MATCEIFGHFFVSDEEGLYAEGTASANQRMPNRTYSIISPLFPPNLNPISYCRSKYINVYIF
jgi:hypothetical protein